MATIAMILRKPPYGDISAAEAVRHALGGVSGDLDVQLILVDGGVLVARKEQDDAGTGYTNLGSTLSDCIEMGVEVHADSGSMKEQGLAQTDLVEGTKIAGSDMITGMLKAAKATMIF